MFERFLWGHQGWSRKAQLGALVIVVSLFAADAEASELLDLDLEQLSEVEVALQNVTVMGGHTHTKGQWMVSASHMYMSMEGTGSLSSEQVLADYPITPTSMSMQSTMLHMMYAPTDKITLAAMLPIRSLSMDHLTRMGGKFTTESSGLGDAHLSALVEVWGGEGPHGGAGHRLLGYGGMSLPTGSINEKGETPLGVVKLPYPMQLGSGTVDPAIGVTYLGHRGNWGWGTHGMAKMRLYDNSNDYHLGQNLHLASWIGRGFSDWLSTTLTLDGKGWTNIVGADTDLNPAMVATADPSLRAGRRVDALISGDLFVPSGLMQGLRLTLAGGVPVYQHLTGPQLETEWMASITLGYTRY